MIFVSCSMEVALIAIIVFTVKSLQIAGLPKKLSPILALILGAVGGVVFLCPGDWRSGFIQGVIMGAAAVGFYSGHKNIFEDIYFRKNRRKSG